MGLKTGIKLLVIVFLLTIFIKSISGLTMNGWMFLLGIVSIVLLLKLSFILGIKIDLLIKQKMSENNLAAYKSLKTCFYKISYMLTGVIIYHSYICMRFDTFVATLVCVFLFLVDMYKKNRDKHLSIAKKKSYAFSRSSQKNRDVVDWSDFSHPSHQH